MPRPVRLSVETIAPLSFGWRLIKFAEKFLLWRLYQNSKKQDAWGETSVCEACPF